MMRRACTLAFLMALVLLASVGTGAGLAVWLVSHERMAGCLTHRMSHDVPRPFNNLTQESTHAS